MGVSLGLTKLEGYGDRQASVILKSKIQYKHILTRPAQYRPVAALKVVVTLLEMVAVVLSEVAVVSISGTGGDNDSFNAER